MGSSYSVHDIPDLFGKVIIITGGTSGIGLVSGMELAKKGAHVILTARNEKRREEALQYMSKELGSTLSRLKIEFGIADQEDLHSMRDFVTWFLQKNIPLHALLLNAGVAYVPFRLIEGIESQLFVNHIAHHYLAGLLLPKLKASAPSRVIVVSSNAFRVVNKLDLSTPRPETYSTIDAYGNSKLANIYFVKALQKRVQNDNIYVNSLHPGTVSTPITEKWAFPWWVMTLVNAGFATLGYSPSKGALTQLYVTTSPDIEFQQIKGQHFYPIANINNCMPDYSQDETAAEQLWDWTEMRIREITARQSGARLVDVLLKECRKDVQEKNMSASAVAAASTPYII